jgi:signal transduction histidine kinase
MTRTGKSILVVEDENIVAMDIRNSLTALGYSVTDCVGTGESAIESVEKHRPSLVLMDIHLRGEMDGIEAAEQILRRFDIPVVYVTAYSDEATLKRARVTEPYGYLLKPFDERELNIVIEMSLFRHTAQREHERLLQERAARAAIEKDHHWMQFLVAAGEHLSASLDLETTLGAIARLAVPQLADITLIQLKEGDEVRTVAVHHVGGKEELIWELLRRYPPDPFLPHGYPQVIRTGQPELLPSIGEGVLVASAVDAENLQLLRALGLRASVCVPLIARGEVFGAMTLAVAESNRVYGQEDLDHAMELARRCASAIDNARLYQEAQQAIVLRDEFLSVASHELRTPLASATLALQNVERSILRLAEESLNKKVKMILQQFSNLSELVDRLLDVSRLATGRVDIRPEELDLAELVRTIAIGLDDSARKAGTTLQVRVPARLEGSWDGLRIGQVLTNLIGNAIKFCGGQPIHVSLDGDEKKAVLIVRDRGIGIPADKLSRIFNRFERGVSARNYGGLGLGLYVARQLVEAHGGQIHAESEPSQGTSFVVELPRRGTAQPGSS